MPYRRLTCVFLMAAGLWWESRGKHSQPKAKNMCDKQLMKPRKVLPRKQGTLMLKSMESTAMTSILHVQLQPRLFPIHVSAGSIT